MPKSWQALLIGVVLGVVAVLGLQALFSENASQTRLDDDVAVDAEGTAAGDLDLDEPPASAPAGTQGGLEQPTPPSDARPATLLRAADGDSFEITWSDDGSVDELRLFGINAPEGDACFGPDARSVLENLIEDEPLLIEDLGRDDFSRVLANVWVGDVFVNATLVERGAALALSDGGEHSNLITRSLEKAQDTGTGLWSPANCGSEDGAAVRIVWIEADAPGRDDQNQNGEWIELANDGDLDVDMTGWSIRDESTRHRYSFPDGYILSVDSSVRVFSGCGDDNAADLFWCDADPVWNNGGDTGFLVAPDGSFVDTLSY